MQCVPVGCAGPEDPIARLEHSLKEMVDEMFGSGQVMREHLCPTDMVLDINSLAYLSGLSVT